MKCYSVGLFVSFSLLAVSFASQSPFQIKENNAIQECNATNPVQRNVREVIGVGIISGERIQISQEEKCHFHCFLQKVGFFDENDNIKGQGLVKYTIQQSPELAKYSDVIIAQVFQIARSIKGFDDKCQKAFVAYHQFGQGVFALLVADELQSSTGVREAINNAIENGKPVDQNISNGVKLFLGFFEAMLNSGVKELQQQQQQQAQAQVSQAQSQVSNVQSQASDAQSQASSVLQEQAKQQQQQAQAQAQAQISQAQSQVSNAQSQASNAQSQASDAQSQASSFLQQQAKQQQQQAQAQAQAQISQAQSQGSNAQSQASDAQSQASSFLQQQANAAGVF